MILDPSTCEPDPDSLRALREWEWDAKLAGRKRQKEPPLPKITTEDIYVNFVEFDRAGYQDYSKRKEHKITSRTAGAFH